MKPFNLEAALKGATVVTREGRPVTQLVLFEAEKDDHPLRGVIDGVVYSFQKDGHFSRMGRETRCDLFMAPKKRTFYVNVFVSRNEPSLKPGSNVYTTQQEAVAAAATSRTLTYLAVAAPLEIEE